MEIVKKHCNMNLCHRRVIDAGCALGVENNFADFFEKIKWG
jgi:hypothetical protein